MSHLSQTDLSEGQLERGLIFLCHLGRNQLPVDVTNIKTVPTDLALTRCLGMLRFSFYTEKAISPLPGLKPTDMH